MHPATTPNSPIMLAPSTTHIVKRNGSKVPLSADRIRARIESLCFGLDRDFVDVNGLVDTIMKGTTDNLAVFFGIL
jgi:hypothetical protein